MKRVEAAKRKWAWLKRNSPALPVKKECMPFKLENKALKM